MFKFHLGWIAGFLAVVSLWGFAPLRAADDKPENVLKKHGLRTAGSLYVLEIESDVQNKVNEARRLAAQLKLARYRQAGTASAKDREDAIKNVSAQIDAYRAELTLANQQINSVPPWGGRWGRGFFGNNAMGGPYSGLVAYRNQLQMAVNQASALLNQLRTQPFDTKAREKVDADVRDRRESYHQAILDLRSLVDKATERYTEAAANEDVKKALEAIGKHALTKPKLGPSPQYVNNVKLLERLEKESADSDTQAAPEKAARHTRKSLRSKRGSRLAPADNPF